MDSGGAGLCSARIRRLAILEVDFKMKWIPTRERLPCVEDFNLAKCDSLFDEYIGNYLVSRKNGVVCSAKALIVYNKYFREWRNIQWLAMMWLDDVVAWQPLPEAYDEDSHSRIEEQQ